MNLKAVSASDTGYCSHLTEGKEIRSSIEVCLMCFLSMHSGSKRCFAYIESFRTPPALVMKLEQAR